MILPSLGHFLVTKVQQQHPRPCLWGLTIFVSIICAPKMPLRGSQWPKSFSFLMLFHAETSPKNFFSGFYGRIFFSPENISIGIWKNKFWWNFGCTFFMVNLTPARCEMVWGSDRLGQQMMGSSVWRSKQRKWTGSFFPCILLPSMFL